MTYNDIDELLAQARAKGSDAKFREWVRTQKSCLSGHFSEWMSNLGEWRNPACHVRRANNSGTSYKPEYACIPMTNGEHAVQSTEGEVACLNQLHRGRRDWSLDDAKYFFDQQRIHYLVMWIRS